MIWKHNWKVAKFMSRYRRSLNLLTDWYITMTTLKDIKKGEIVNSWKTKTIYENVNNPKEVIVTNRDNITKKWWCFFNKKSWR